MKLNNDLSAYLDLLRFLAALAVLLGHMDLDGIPMWSQVTHFSHEAVVVFFVMSGFIIYTSTVGRHASLVDYFVARSSRIYSVALPAVLFSIMASEVMVYVFPEAGAHMSNFRPFSLADIACSLLFLNESWGNPSGLTLNGPYWSLCYEVWYYIIFGAYFFAKGQWRWPLVFICCGIAGPAVLALFPIWIAGAWLASRGRRLGRPAFAWPLFFGSLIAIALVDFFDLDHTIRLYLRDHVPGFWRLGGAQRMLTDYLIGLALLLHLRAFDGLPVWAKGYFGRHRTVFRFAAGFSFTLYLFHRPLTQILGYLLPQENSSIFRSFGLCCLIMMVCLLASFLTERQLGRWRHFFERALLHLKITSPTSSN